MRTPFFPWLQYAALALLAGVLITMGVSKDWRISWIVGVPWVLLLAAAYVWRKRAAAAQPAGEVTSSS